MAYRFFKQSPMSHTLCGLILLLVGCSDNGKTESQSKISRPEIPLTKVVDPGQSTPFQPPDQVLEKKPSSKSRKRVYLRKPLRRRKQKQKSQRLQKPQWRHLCRLEEAEGRNPLIGTTGRLHRTVRMCGARKSEGWAQPTHGVRRAFERGGVAFNRRRLRWHGPSVWPAGSD